MDAIHGHMALLNPTPPCMATGTAARSWLDRARVIALQSDISTMKDLGRCNSHKTCSGTMLEMR